MRIVQITDLHLPAEDENARGVDTWKNLDRILSMTEEYSPDLVVFTGDICYDIPQNSIYDKFKSVIADLRWSLRFIAGNHDTQSAIDNIIKERNEENIYPCEKTKSCDIIYLNSPNAVLDSKSYELLSAKSQRKTTSPLLIFIHHPPVKLGVPYMDEKHAFAEAEKIKETLKNSPRTPYIFCGHYHNERSLHRRDYNIYCTPSIYIQIDDKYKDFHPLTDDIALRVIDVNEEGIKTFVRYAEGFSV